MFTPTKLNWVHAIHSKNSDKIYKNPAPRDFLLAHNYIDMQLHTPKKYKKTGQSPVSYSRHVTESNNASIVARRFLSVKNWARCSGVVLCVESSKCGIYF